MPELVNLAQLDAKLWVSPQLRIEDLAPLRAAGFRRLVNNRPDGEEPGQPPSAQLAAEAARLGLDYRHIPIVPGLAEDADALDFAEVLASTEGRVLAFCRSGARSKRLWQRSRELLGQQD